MQANSAYQHTPLPRNQVTTKGDPTCRFELFVRWPESAGRNMNPFKYRGDRFNIIEPDKMLCSLLKLFMKDHPSWMFAELWDNTYPLNDCNRLVLEMKGGKIIKNRLQYYELMLQNFPLPEYLKTPVNP